MLKFVVTSDCQEFPHICSSGSLCCSCHMSTLSLIATDTLERMTGNVDFSPSPRFPTLPTYHILHKQILHDLLTGLELLIRPKTTPVYCSACSVNILDLHCQTLKMTSVSCEISCDYFSSATFKW